MSLQAPVLAAVAAAGQAPSSVVLSNLAYLIGAVVLAIVITTVVAIRHRRPRSTEEDMDSFHRGLAALAPDRGGRHRSGMRARPTPPRLESPSVRPQPGPRRVPVRADGSAPRRPSTRSKSG